MSYYFRITLCSILLALGTAGLVTLGPRSDGLRLAAQAPNGEEVAAGSPVRVTFSRPVDRPTAEASFRIDPPAPGRFSWEEETLIFQPSRPLSPDTDYTITFIRGLKDEQGRANTTDLRWTFRTRGVRLLVLRAAEDGASELWLVAPDGQRSRQILRASNTIDDVIVAPDGVRVVYVERRDSERNVLMLLELESGVTRPLVDDPGFSADAPAWASAGDFIAFERRALEDDVLGQPQVWLTQPDGSLLGSLLSSDDSSYAPSWSPDGNSVAFVSGEDRALSVYNFFTDLTTPLSIRSSEQVAWLPDGSALVVSDAGGSAIAPQLRRIGIDAPYTVSDLSDGVGVELTPAVSPDGLRVVYARRDPQSFSGSIWLAPLDGGPGRQLSAEGSHQDTQPTWSPDGRHIAFIRTDSTNSPSGAAMVVSLESGLEQAVLTRAVRVAWAP